MKKSLLTALALLLSVTILAQNNINIIDEDFSGDAIPEGWYSSGNGANNWYISYSFSAGGKPNEIMLSWSPQFNGISRFVSPAVDLSGVTNVILSLDHYLALYSGNPKIGVATSSDNGTTWNSVWSQTYDKTDKYNVIETIEGPDMGKENVRFCIYYEGSSSYISSWYFDNFKVYTIEDLNIGMSSIDIPSYISQGDNNISFTVENLGESPIKSFEARYFINGNEEASETFYTEIAYNEKKQFTFENTYNFSFGNDYEIEIEIFRVNDSEDDTSDNTSTKKTIVSMGETQRIPMIEHFSSSTCAPCVQANYGMTMLTENNPGKYTYTKYPMNWPAPGDPYFTKETETKRFYYNISGAPELYLDGKLYGMTFIDNDSFNERYKTPAYTNVRGSFTMNGNTINIIADFMSYFDTDNIKAYISINEKTTTENALPVSEHGNGETEFHHIMMKMLNDANGNTLNIKAGEYQRLVFSFDMSQTFMEETNDLEVALWMQDDDTKEIFNSHFAYEYSEHVYPVQNLKTYINDNILTVRWDAPEKGNPTGYNVYIDGKIVEENTSSLEYSSELNNSKTVEVTAIYDNNKTSVNVAKIITAENNVNENTANLNNINIYPNPANDKLHIETDENVYEINIYNINGQRVNKSTSQRVIDVAGLKSGIYFIKIETDNGNIVRKFIKN